MRENKGTTRSFIRAAGQAMKAFHNTQQTKATKADFPRQLAELQEKLKKPLKTRVARQEISIKDQMFAVVDRLKVSGGRMTFTELFPYEDKQTLIVTFLSLLELMKRQVVFVEQTNNFEELTVLLQKEEIGDELEEFDE